MGAAAQGPQSHLLGVGGVGGRLQVCLLPLTIPTVDVEGGLFWQVYSEREWCPLSACPLWAAGLWLGRAFGVQSGFGLSRRETSLAFS